jgi:Secretion system C-terminal sorting domain/PKD-like domain
MLKYSSKIIILFFLLCSYVSHGQFYLPISGSSEVSPNVHTTYDIYVPAYDYALYGRAHLGIVAIGGRIVRIERTHGPSGNYNTNSVAFSTNPSEYVKVTVVWDNNQCYGSINAQLSAIGGTSGTPPLSMYGGVPVNITLGDIQAIYGPTLLNCTMNMVSYSTPSVSGADSYVWEVSNGLSITSSGAYATINFGTWQGTATLTLTVRRNACNAVKTQTITITRGGNYGAVPINGPNNVAVGSVSNYYEVLTDVPLSNMSWVLYAGEGWELLGDFNGQVTNSYVRVKAPLFKNRTAVLVFYATDPCGNAVEGSIHIATDEMIALERSMPEKDNAEFNIYPNPVSNTEKVTIGGISGQTGTVIIYNRLGKEVKRLENVENNTSFDVTNLKNGIYTIKFLNSSIAKTFSLIVR